MDVAFWESVADTYEAEIFNVLASDRESAVLSCIDAFASRDLAAADLGCGIGRWLPHLAEKFGAVLAVDISDKCLEHARSGAEPFENITYLSADLTKPGPRLGKADFVLCVNVAIMPDAEARWALLGNVARCVRSEGHLLLVVPSLESALYTKHRLVEWQLKDGQEEREAWLASADKRFTSLLDLQKGIVTIEGVRTKHYLREELVTILDALRLTVQRADKVEYRWDTEFTDPPRWLKRPYPWDWMVLARKR
jgi:SAM-dependent methyltransferase